MRKLLISAALALCAPAAVLAQDAPKVEVFGGYSYQITEEEIGGHGWEASIAGNFTDWFGVKADFSGHYGSDSERLPPLGFPIISPGLPQVPALVVDTDVSEHRFLVGPQFTLRSDRFSVFAHGLVGASRRNIDFATTLAPDVLGPIPPFEQTFKRTDFAAAVGGGVDIKITDGLAYRVQADYAPTRDNGQTRDNARISTGIVFRFGR
jgi:opacity protein-like surface antigen